MNTKAYQTRITKMIVLPEGEQLFSEMATSIEIMDESAGEYLLIEQEGNEKKFIEVTIEEWPHLQKAIETMFKSIIQ